MNRNREPESKQMLVPSSRAGQKWQRMGALLDFWAFKRKQIPSLQSPIAHKKTFYLLK